MHNTLIIWKSKSTAERTEGDTAYTLQQIYLGQAGQCLKFGEQNRPYRQAECGGSRCWEARGKSEILEDKTACAPVTALWPVIESAPSTVLSCLRVEVRVKVLFVHGFFWEGDDIYRQKRLEVALQNKNYFRQLKEGLKHDFTC